MRAGWAGKAGRADKDLGIADQPHQPYQTQCVSLNLAVSAQQLPPKPAPDGLTTSRTWTDDDLDRVMKQLQPLTTNLRKMIDAHEAKSAEAHADSVEHILGDVEDFFDSRDMPEAEARAEDASDHANHVEDAAEAKNFDKAGEHLKLLMATCQSCHDRFRERDANGEHRLKKP